MTDLNQQTEIELDIESLGCFVLYSSFKGEMHIQEMTHRLCKQTRTVSHMMQSNLHHIRYNNRIIK